jgi:hypothetical protein
MKKAIIFSTLALMAGIFPACRKEMSIENNNGLGADFTAVIGESPWEAAAGTQGASMIQGMIYITGISADGRQLSIALNNPVNGPYPLGRYSSDLAVYAGPDSSGAYAFSTNQGSNNSQAGSTVTVTALDLENMTISGIFSFKVYRNFDSTGLNITSGVFYKIPLTGSPVLPQHRDTLTAAIDSFSWVGQGILTADISGQLVMSGSALDGVRSLTLVMPDNTGPGVYALTGMGNNYTAVYNPYPTLSLVSSSGSLTVLQNDPTMLRIRGNFQFQGTETQGLGTASSVSNGYFSIYYGQ